MGEVPGREGVGAVALVHERDGALHIGIGQVAEVVPDLLGDEHALVDEGARGEGRDVEVVEGARELAADLRLDALPNDVELPLQGVAGQAGGRGDEDLLDPRLQVLRELADDLRVDGHVAPAQQRQPLLLDDLLQEPLAEVAVRGQLRQKDHADAVFARGREDEAAAARDAGGGGALLAEELVGHLDHDPGAVARAGVATAGAAVSQVLDDPDALVDDVVGLAVVDVRDEAHTARVVLECGVVEACLLQVSDHCRPSFLGSGFWWCAWVTIRGAIIAERASGKTGNDGSPGSNDQY